MPHIIFHTAEWHNSLSCLSLIPNIAGWVTALLIKQHVFAFGRIQERCKETCWETFAWFQDKCKETCGEIRIWRHWWQAVWSMVRSIFFAGKWLMHGSTCWLALNQHTRNWLIHAYVCVCAWLVYPYVTMYACMYVYGRLTPIYACMHVCMCMCMAM
jgi:hypothetical protein